VSHRPWKISVRLWLQLATYSVLFCFNAAQAQIINCDLSFSGATDFYEPSRDREAKINVVVNRHLTKEMLQLKRGSTGTIAADIDYTLGRIPNHPQALELASRLKSAVDSGLKPKTEKLRRGIECYFTRAATLNSQIGETHYIWGLHLQRAGDISAAYEKYRKAQALGEDSAEFYYNFGLLHFADNKYKEAKEMANKAYSMGFPLQGLRRKLKSKGFEPDAVTIPK